MQLISKAGIADRGRKLGEAAGIDSSRDEGTSAKIIVKLRPLRTHDRTALWRHLAGSDSRFVTSDFTGVFVGQFR